MQPGLLLSNRYRLVSLLGSGGMGTVWRADHLGLNAPVAVKLLSADLGSAPEAIARFQREAQSAATIRSPHVVQILDHGVDPTLHAPFIVMELLEGQSLADRLAVEGRISPDETARLVAQIARALTRAHELGIVHRDLKPANVFLVRNEDEWMAKVLDFGIAKWQPALAEASALTGTNAVMGTPYYMSPEQLTAARFVDHRTDLWALAVIVYECLTGTRPFMADNVMGIGIKINAAEVPPVSAFGFPAEFDAFFARGLARAPEQRFQSARELADELKRLLQAAPFAASPQVTAVLPEAPASPQNAAGVAPSAAGAAAATGPSSRTMTAVEAARAPAPVSPVRRSRAPYALGGLLVLGGLGAALVQSFGAEPSVPAGLSSAAGALLSQAAPPPKILVEAQPEQPPATPSVATPSAATPSVATAAAAAPEIEVVPSALPPPPKVPAEPVVLRPAPSARPRPRPAATSASPGVTKSAPRPAATQPNVYDSRH